MRPVGRLYLFIVAAVTLGMLLTGLSALGASFLSLALGAGAIDPSFQQWIATAAAGALVGAGGWAVHWGLAQRAARGDAAERASTLRRLYLYGVAGALLVAGALQATDLLERLFVALQPARRGFDAVGLLTAAWQGTLLFAFWAYHFRQGALDRGAAGETGASATLRRWYAYGAQLAALVTVLLGTRELIRAAASLGVPQADALSLGAWDTSTIARTLVWVAIWTFHVRWADQPSLYEEDRRGTLRVVHAFAVVALSVALVLADGSRLFYYGLARALGVEAPGGVRQLDLPTIAEPISTLLVFGIAWAFMRHRLAMDVAEAEAPRQAGVRRLYRHLVALLSLASLSAGAGGIAFTLLDQTIGPALAATRDTWRDQVSLSVTLIAVGLPVWLAHWRPAPAAAERLALSRRLYLFGALLVSVLSVTAAGGVLLYTAILALLTGDLASRLSQASAPLAVILIGGIVAGYHLRVLRGDAAVRGAQEAELRPGQVVERAALVVEIVGATEAEVQQALAGLPPGTRYSLREADRG